jgi:hypothetical protein
VVRITKELFKKFDECAKIKDPKERRLCEYQVGAREMKLDPELIKKHMNEKGIIKRIDLWNFIQEHKDKTKDEFGGWLIGQEIEATSKIIMAIDLWNEVISDRLKAKFEEEF